MCVRGTSVCVCVCQCVCDYTVCSGLMLWYTLAPPLCVASPLVQHMHHLPLFIHVDSSLQRVETWVARCGSLLHLLRSLHGESHVALWGVGMYTCELYIACSEPVLSAACVYCTTVKRGICVLCFYCSVWMGCTYVLYILCTLTYTRCTWPVLFDCCPLPLPNRHTVTWVLKWFCTCVNGCGNLSLSAYLYWLISYWLYQ